MKHLATAALVAASIAASVQTANAGNFLDPCIDMHNEFRGQKHAILAAYDADLAKVDGMIATAAFRDIWLREKKADMRPYFDKNVAPVAKQLGQTDMNAAFESWFAVEIEKAGGDNLINAHFREDLKRVLTEERAGSSADLARQQRELNDACKMDTGNQALRVASKLVVEGIAAPISVPVGIVKGIDANIKGAARESGEIDKVIKGTTGISVKDIKKHGVFGGPNSVFRKPFG